ncbi:MAG TPA: universal stress protein [Amnibacterium sp.]|nr:universal stress protein [Amnibacterium sp.]
MVVVPDTDRLFAHGVALGVEDSPSGRAAGAFAGEEAASLGQRLTLVRAWRADGVHDESRRVAVLEGSARRDAGHLLDRVRDSAGHLHPDIPIDIRNIHGAVAHVLVRSSAHAQLLVLGVARPAPGARPMLGAVGTAALRHMRAPIAFVHAALPEDPHWEDAMWEGWADRVVEAPGFRRGTP